MPKLIIEHQDIKREIEGPMQICISRKELKKLIKKLRKELKNDFCYGWIDLPNKNKKQDSIANQAPLKWKENIN
jgi:sRNA-binding carbon storage regulator CsrA